VSVHVDIQNTAFQLLAEKAIYLNAYDILLVADLHLGKVNHFRRSGIPAPTQANEENLDRLILLLQRVKPQRVLFMGDLFHSHYNEEWEAFGQTLKYFPSISFELVMGNHDILSEYQYMKHALKLHARPIIIDNLLISHEPVQDIPQNLYNLAGHIHPGVSLRGKGRQGVKLPCFWFGEKQGLLPAFGAFTGLAKLRPKKGDKVFVVVENKVIDVS